MTKKHFIIIAQTIAQIVNLQIRIEVAYLFAARCEQDNPRFNRALFLKACRVEE